MSLGELNRLTGNFGSKAFIGEGSYGRVFYAKLSDGTDAAIKKLDSGSSQEPDSDFAAQVKFSFGIVNPLEQCFASWYCQCHTLHYVTMDHAAISCFKTEASKFCGVDWILSRGRQQNFGLSICKFGFLA